MSKPEYKLRICIDFDGVIHMYTSKWAGADKILDEPVPGAIEWLHANKEQYELYIFSSRNFQEGGIDAMKSWILFWLERKYGLYLAKVTMNALQFPTEKPSAHLYIDDRAWHFQGRFPTDDQIKSFKPWNKQK